MLYTPKGDNPLKSIYGGQIKNAIYAFTTNTKTIPSPYEHIVTASDADMLFPVNKSSSLSGVVGP